jgi:hypothetical protein
MLRQHAQQDEVVVAKPAHRPRKTQQADVGAAAARGCRSQNRRNVDAEAGLAAAAGQQSDRAPDRPRSGWAARTSSRGGISHSAEEYSAPAWIQAGADVLLQTLLALDAAER